MSTLRRRHVLLGLAALLCLVAGGVAFALQPDESRSGRVCTLKKGPGSGVVVIVREREAGTFLRARAWLGTRSRTLRQRQVLSADVHTAGFPMPNGPATRTLVLVLERAGGPAEVLARNVRMERWEENGPRCGTDWVAVVRYVNGKLAQVPYAGHSRHLMSD